MTISYSISGDWTEIAPGVRVRLQDAPNEEDMECYDPHGVVILQVALEPPAGRSGQTDIRGLPTQATPADPYRSSAELCRRGRAPIAGRRRDMRTRPRAGRRSERAGVRRNARTTSATRSHTRPAGTCSTCAARGAGKPWVSGRSDEAR